MKYKEIKILSSIIKNQNYNQDKLFLNISKSNDVDTFVTNAVPIVSGPSNKSLFVKILFEGDPYDVPVEILEKLLWDNSYNPLKPFRWYKNAKEHISTIVADVNNHSDVINKRTQSWDGFLELLENPDKVWIYELTIL